MQDSISKLIKKFREHDPYHYSKNKQNDYKRQPLGNTDHKDQLIFLNRRIKSLENSVDALVTDANRVIKYYQDLVRQHIFHHEQLKEEFASFKLTASQQKKDFEAQLQELTEKMEFLKSESMRKQIQFFSLLQKYEDYQQCITQLRKQDQQNLIQLQDKMKRQSCLFQEKISHSQLQAKQFKSKMLQMLPKVESLQSENDFLKKLAEELVQQNQCLKSKFLEQNAEIQLQRSKSTQKQCYLQQDFECLSRQDESQLKNEEPKLADSRQMHLNMENEILNISEHYSKYNQTDQMRSKQHSNYHFVMLGSNQGTLQKMKDQRRKSLKNKQAVARLFSNGLVRINTGESERSVPRYEPEKDGNINEVREFNMLDSQQNPMINPYKAFFQIMTQCQKMNSPNFCQICNIDVSHLYNVFVAGGIPYTVWQSQIRKALRIKQF